MLDDSIVMMVIHMLFLLLCVKGEAALAQAMCMIYFMNTETLIVMNVNKNKSLLFCCIVVLRFGQKFGIKTERECKIQEQKKNMYVAFANAQRTAGVMDKMQFIKMKMCHQRLFD